MYKLNKTNNDPLRKALKEIAESSYDLQIANHVNSTDDNGSLVVEDRDEGKITVDIAKKAMRYDYGASKGEEEQDVYSPSVWGYVDDGTGNANHYGYGAFEDGSYSLVQIPNPTSYDEEGDETDVVSFSSTIASLSISADLFEKQDDGTFLLDPTSLEDGANHVFDSYSGHASVDDGSMMEPLASLLMPLKPMSLLSPIAIT